MKCKYCGCIDGHACVGGCSWIKPNVCSNCVIRVNQCHKELEAYLDDPNTEEIVVQIFQKDTGGEPIFLEIIKLNKKKKILK